MKLHYHQEINDLNTQVARLGGLVENAVAKALVALREGNTALASEVDDADDVIDRLEVDLEARCLKILALYHPVAKDLRFIVSVLKVANELEHMGDLAQHIAQKAHTVPVEVVRRSEMEIQTMGHKVKSMVGLALDAMLKGSVETARRVIAMDDEVDAFHRRNHQVLSETITNVEQPHKLSHLSLLSVSRSLERIADMAGSIAEDVVYFVEGRIVRHEHSNL